MILVLAGAWLNRVIVRKIGAIASDPLAPCYMGDYTDLIALTEYWLIIVILDPGHIDTYRAVGRHILRDEINRFPVAIGIISAPFDSKPLD